MSYKVNGHQQRLIDRRKKRKNGESTTDKPKPKPIKK